MDTVLDPLPAAALPELVCRAFASGPPTLRARMLETLLQPLRPLSLVAVAAGAFGRYLHRDAWGRVQVSVDDALAFTADQVSDLAGFVIQVAPDALVQAAQLAQLAASVLQA